MKFPLPDEVTDALEKASNDMDDMNTKLDTVVELLTEIRDILKEKL